MDASAQLALDLKPSFGWGGRRAGAGRKPGGARRVRHASRPAFSRHHPSHLTLRVRPGIPSLRSVRLVRELECSLRQARVRPGFRLVAYSVQRDHVHLLVEAEDARALACGMKSVGARVALAVRRIFGGRGPVLLERFHQRVVRTPREVRNALAYVMLNARKHAAALGLEMRKGLASVDPASSGRWFRGWARSVPPASDSPAVAEARTWLLRVGWLRHGRIDPWEIPRLRRR